MSSARWTAAAKLTGIDERQDEGQADIDDGERHAKQHEIARPYVIAARHRDPAVERDAEPGGTGHADERDRHHAAEGRAIDRDDRRRDERRDGPAENRRADQDDVMQAAVDAAAIAAVDDRAALHCRDRQRAEQQAHGGSEGAPRQPDEARQCHPDGKGQAEQYEDARHGVAETA